MAKRPTKNPAGVPVKRTKKDPLPSPAEDDQEHIEENKINRFYHQTLSVCRINICRCVQGNNVRGVNVAVNISSNKK